ncbi:MAG: NYN domain-containing protein, partial [Oscillospiraceae bacterium]
GKNATDSAMIIDAMDILYTGSIEGFCIVSSDSDFTRLAVRLREAGMYVVGMGEKKTPKPFIAACNKFTYLELLSQKVQTEKKDNSEKKSDNNEMQRVLEQIRLIVEENSDDDGWAHLGTIGTILIKRSPDFDVRNFGFSKLTPFIKSLSEFEVRSENNKPGTARVVYIKVKD